MGKPRNTYKYKFKVKNKIVHKGITEDLERREQEHQHKWPNGHIKQVGRKTTEEAAREWEKDQGYTYRRGEGGYYSKEEVSKRVSPKTKKIVKRGIVRYHSDLEKLAKE